MKPFRVGRWVCALILLASGAAPVQAAWDNVFQVCCNSCQKKPVISRFFSSRYSPPACCPTTSCYQQQTCCTTQYVQRSYYQPVTCYQSKSYYEPVTSYKTSYYYEPVTSYRYSCYYDPCTCSYQQVACPTTSYRLRSQTCATTSYLQRTCQVPVTSYRLSYYYEPVTSCQTTPVCPTPCATGVAAAPAPVAVAPGVAEYPTTPPTAGVQEQQQPPQQQAAPPAGNGTGAYDRYYPTPAPTQPPPVMPPATGSQTYRQLTPPAPPARPAAPPTVRLDRIVSIPQPAGDKLEGQVVQLDNAPRAGTQLTFVNVSRQEDRQPVTADGTGKFQVNLASGKWLVYLTGADGKPIYHSQIEVGGTANRQIILVSR